MGLSIRQSRGRWYLRITGRRGEKERLVPSGGFATKAEATRELTAARAREASAMSPEPPRAVGRMPFRELADLWWTGHAEVHVSANTRRGYRSLLKRLKEWFDEDLPVGAIGLVQVEEFIAALLQGGASSQTVTHHVNLLKQIVDWGAHPARGFVAKALPSITKPKLKRESEPLPLKPDELARLIDTAPAPFNAVLAMAALHGLRPGELLALRRCDVTRDRLHVRLTKDSTGATHEPKTGEARSLPLDPTVLPLLRDVPFHGDPTAPIFPRLTTKRAQKEMRAALGAAGIPRGKERILYDLRHTYASIAISALRVDPATLANRMGNSTDVLWKHYATYWEGLSPSGKAVLSDAFKSRRRGLRLPFGRKRVGSNGAPDAPLPWEIPANEERTTGFEPATFGLGSRRSTN